MRLEQYLPDLRARDVWLDIRDLGTTANKLLQDIDTQAFSAILAAPEQISADSGSGTRLAMLVGGGANGETTRADIQVFDDPKKLSQMRDSTRACALLGKVGSEDELTQFAHDLAVSKADYGIVELVDETNIPLELLIAWFQNAPTKILKCVSTTEEGDIALRTLQHGADGLLLRTATESEFRSATSLVSVESTNKLELVEWNVTSAKYIGWGHRALVDTVSLLTQEEGMLIGSTCSAFAMMCSETHYLPYMPLRPFRVNAGAVHSYLVCPSDRTHYLADLELGHHALVVDTQGNGRSVPVGRVKIEKRPLISIDFEDKDGDTGNIIVQADWHVRIMNADGKPLHVTHCKPGTKLMGWKSVAARHCGNPINEQLIER